MQVRQTVADEQVRQLVSHLKQLVEAGSLKYPGLQASHLSAPVVQAVQPSLQGRHSVLPAFLKKPVGQASTHWSGLAGVAVTAVAGAPPAVVEAGVAGLVGMLLFSSMNGVAQVEQVGTVAKSFAQAQPTGHGLQAPATR